MYVTIYKSIYYYDKRQQNEPVHTSNIKSTTYLNWKLIHKHLISIFYRTILPGTVQSFDVNFVLIALSV